MATGGGESIPTVDHEEFFDWACAKCRDNDRTTEAVFFCPDCDEAFCDACVKDHNRFLRKHVVSGREKKSDWGKTSGPRCCEDECQEHRGQTISIYCGRHDDVCCPSCALWKHTDECKSKMLPVCEMLQSLDLKADVNTVMNDADKLMIDLSRTEHDIDEMLIETESDRNTLLSEIETFSHTITSHINQLKEQAIIKANKLYGDRERELAKDQQTCKEKIRELQQLKLKLQETGSVSDATVFVRMKTSQRRLVESSKESSELSHHRNLRFSFKTNPIATQIECQVSNLGTFCVDRNEPSNTSQEVPYKASKANEAKDKGKGVDNEEIETCLICMDDLDDSRTLDCGHSFCKDCLEQALNVKPVCPTCGKVCGVLTGDQPKGSMTYLTDGFNSVAGYDVFGTIQIIYNFPSGKQEENHPNPGQPYAGILRKAYLPDNKEGNLIFQMLKIAFARKLVFTIGRSVTTGQEGIITWNDIHHKTNPQPYGKFGYPDTHYLARVKDDLKAKGITEEDIPSDELRQINRRRFKKVNNSFSVKDFIEKCHLK